MNVIMASKFSEISISIPPEIAVCGICGAEVVLDIDEYEEDDGGLWAASKCGVHVDCVTAPPIDDENAWCSPLCSIIRWRSFIRQGLVVRANGSINFLEMQAFIQSRAFVGLRGAGKKVVSEWREWLAAQDVAGE